MDCTARLEFTYADDATAQRVFASVHADDDAHCATSRAGRGMIALLRGDSPRSLLRAADDLLGCVAVAEDVIRGPGMARQDAGH
jgi:hypothetical protein